MLLILVRQLLHVLSTLSCTQDKVYLALQVLVTACPCALVLSTPVVVVAGLTAAAKNGILIKGGHVLESMSAVKILTFDKTGTLTQGRFQVTHHRMSSEDSLLSYQPSQPHHLVVYAIYLARCVHALTQCTSAFVEVPL